MSARVAPMPPAAEPAAAPSTSTADVPYTSGCEQNVGDRRQQEDTFVRLDDLNKLVADLAPSVGRDVRRAFWAVYDGFGGQSSSLWLKSHLHEHLVCHARFESDPAAALAAVFAEADAKLLEYNAARDAERGAGGGPRKSAFAGVVYEEAGGGGGGGGGGEKGASSVEEQVGEIRQQLRGAAAFWKRAQTASLAAVRLGGRAS